jgi:CheY-like chemotaxis protein
MKRAFVLEDNDMLQCMFCEFLRFAGYEVFFSSIPEGVVERIRENDVDLVLSDVNIHKNEFEVEASCEEVLEFAKRIMNIKKEITLIFTSGDSIKLEGIILLMAKKIGVYIEGLSKPVDMNIFLAAIRKCG